MALPIPDDPATAVATGAVAGSGVLLMFSRLARRLFADKTEMAGSAAHTGLIEMLHAEITRLSEQNIRLAAAVEELQDEVRELRVENARLASLIMGKHNGSQDSPRTDQQR